MDETHRISMPEEIRSAVDAAKGETVVLTRDGEPVAKVVPISTLDTSASRAAAERIKRWQRVPLQGLTIREMIDEGRR